MLKSSFQRCLWWARTLLLQVLLLFVYREALDLSDPVKGLSPRVLLLLLRGSSLSGMHTMAATLDTPFLGFLAEATAKDSTLIQVLGGC
jgi:hypothetical protein